MRKFTNVARKMLLNEEGAALVEYGLLVGLIALVCVAAVTALGEKIRDLFTAINNKLVVPPAGP